MKILSPDFELNKYGLEARLVREDDAEFIIKLRTSPKAKNFLHYTSPNVNEQREWIRKYKLREEEGKEYYFIFSRNDVKLGVFRLYNICGDSFTGGSWVFEDKVPMEYSVAGVLLSLDVAFFQLDMAINDLFDGVNKDNKNVLMFNKMLGVDFYAKRESADGVFYVGRLTKESYEKKRVRLLKIIGF